ncbi:patatin-like phospholipase family protein [Brevundimonas sp.]|uniref:patatin-like phospholipase family protein n=1 Tax=Brevundimonas sp. TaxID=1871086 RepID=UPI0028AD0A9A|nr:patatin-like phospholipase family protein [Brevundimonas sp.]
MAETEANIPAAETRPLRPIFAIFEGGGAKGVAHVGALEAIKANGLEIIGVAGTSAGALAAVLVAIGLEAADVMDPLDPDKHILAPHSPLDILGRAEWRKMDRLRTRNGPLKIGTALMGVPGAFLASPRNAATLREITRQSGLLSTDAIRAFVDTVIRNRLADINRQGKLRRRVPKRITFKALQDNWPTVIPLKIVATDVDQGTLELFDADNTPDVLVAEAVAASISIPIAFQPALIPSYRPGRFADGGMVSNLPIWVFAEDKLAYERGNYEDPPVPTVGFTLAPPDPPEPKTQGWWQKLEARLGGALLDYSGRLLHATLAGSQGTALRFLEDVTVIRLKTDLDTFDFDRPWTDYDAARRSAFDQADQHLKFFLDAKPDRIRTVLDEIRADALKEINRVRGANGRSRLRKLRVSLIEPSGHRSLRITASVGMETDADDRLLLDRRGRGAAQAFRDRDMLSFRLSAGLTRRHAEYMTKYERALVRTSVRTVMCVPIFKDPDSWNRGRDKRAVPLGILAIDSDVNLALEFKVPQLQTMLTKCSNVLYEAVSSKVDHG